MIFKLNNAGYSKVNGKWTSPDGTEYENTLEAFASIETTDVKVVDTEVPVIVEDEDTTTGVETGKTTPFAPEK